MARSSSCSTAFTRNDLRGHSGGPGGFMKTLAVALCAALAGAGASALMAQTTEPVDAAMVAKIRDEGLNRSQVKTVFNQFVDVIGARLTGSSEHKRAAEWA